MQRPNESGWIGRCISAVRAMFGSETSAELAPVIAPVSAPAIAIETPSPLADAMTTQGAPAQRMLAARLAVQAKLNVPTGKKARVAPIVSAKTANRRPVEVAVVKRSPQARSVFLPARHLAAKAVPKARANVITLPVAKVVRPIAKQPQVRPNRIAA